jgi:hypothetical protein
MDGPLLRPARSTPPQRIADVEAVNQVVVETSH